jgi:hypothetical protein
VLLPLSKIAITNINMQPPAVSTSIQMPLQPVSLLQLLLMPTFNMANNLISQER